MHQKISTLSSNTWLTGLTALRDRLRQRYCLVAWRKGVISTDELEGKQTSELLNRSACDLRMVSTRWRERSLDLIA
jgi:hypothetical protein